MILQERAIADPKSTTNEAFYTTDAFTDYAIRFLKEELVASALPYLAYTAPHWPLQAFEDGVASTVEIQDRLGQLRSNVSSGKSNPA